MVYELPKACKKGFAQICLMQIRRKNVKTEEDRGKNDGKCYICKPKAQVCTHDMEGNNVFTILAQICLSVCTYLLRICPEQICTNTFFRAVRVLNGK